MQVRAAVVSLVVLVWSLGSQAEPRAGEIPPVLQPWIPWVLADHEDAACAHLGDAALCEWPSSLELDVGPDGGSFAERLRADRATTVVLPGSLEAWPREVHVDGKPAVVLETGEARLPSVRLDPGDHRLDGRFRWPALPERIRVPPATGLLSLRVGAQAVPFPRRDEDGRVWLAAGGVEEGEAERLDLSVHRRIEDGVPLFVTTRLELRVSGRAREVNLGQVLLEATVPVSITSELPTRLDPKGELHAQVAAGNYRIELAARSDGSPASLAKRLPADTWPDNEVWVWQADEALRQVDVKGAPAVDPARTDLADDWRGLPTFLVKPGTRVSFDTTRRGEPDPPPSRVTLQREYWLDLDGRGYTVRDQLHAELRQAWRLDLHAGTLEHVTSNEGDLLVTRTPGGKGAGIEIRRASEDLTAEWSAPDALSHLPAVGWSEDVQSLASTLHLGPGWSVLAASGVDEMDDTWVERWDLFDFFFVLLVALAIGRLLGRRYAVLALVTLVVCQHEAGAPSMVWLVLVGFAALAGLRGTGRLASIARGAFLVTTGAFALIALPFAIAQVRSAIYPQLGTEDGLVESVWPGTSASAPMREAVALERAAAPGAPPPVPASAAVPVEAEQEPPQKQQLAASANQDEPADWLQRGDGKAVAIIGLGGAYGGDSNLRAKSRVLEQDPEAVVQTGQGMPTWRWRAWSLRWNGPVDRDHAIRLWLVPPTANRVLALVRVLLVGLLAFVLARKGLSGTSQTDPPTPGSAGGGAGPGASAAAALALVVLVPAVARAQWPDAELLRELRTRVTKPAPCRPACVSIDQLRVHVEGDRLALVFDVQAGDHTTVRLPGPASAWTPSEVLLDRTPGAPVRVHDDGFLHVRVEPGQHVIEAAGPLPARDAITLAMGDSPHHVEVDAAGWNVDGVREDGRVQDAIQLSRVLVSVGANEPARGEELPPWLVLERSFELGPIWQVRSTLRRVSPVGTPILVQVALLPGEAVAESALEVKDASVEVPLGRDDTEVSWTSTLDPREGLELRAAEKAPWSERWTLRCGPIWRCATQGLAPIRHQQDGTWAPEFAPWPGESVVLIAERPPAAAGQSVTIDSAELDVTPGVRIREATLTLHVRSSRGGVQRVTLPAPARVRSLNIDGVERPLRAKDGVVTFTLAPSAQRAVLTWQEPQGIGAVERAPTVRVHAPAANASVVIRVPSDRWLLWASGPAWGPAILFWGYLLVVLIAGFALGRVRTSPLRGWQWALLGLGLTQVDAPVALVVVGWFFLIDRRARMPEQRVWVHNLVQLALIGASAVWVGCVYDAVHTGLLVQPDMQVSGAGSQADALRWYVDRVHDAMPVAGIVSAPMWLWRALMLAWALWLAVSLVSWVPWAWRSFRAGGVFRRRTPPSTGPGTPPASASAPLETPDAWRPIEPLP